VFFVGSVFFRFEGLDVDLFRELRQLTVRFFFLGQSLIQESRSAVFS